MKLDHFLGDTLWDGLGHRQQASWSQVSQGPVAKACAVEQFLDSLSHKLRKLGIFMIKPTSAWFCARNAVELVRNTPQQLLVFSN